MLELSQIWLMRAPSGNSWSFIYLFCQLLGIESCFLFPGPPSLCVFPGFLAQDVPGSPCAFLQSWISCFSKRLLVLFNPQWFPIRNPNHCGELSLPLHPMLFGFKFSFTWSLWLGKWKGAYWYNGHQIVVHMVTWMVSFIHLLLSMYSVLDTLIIQECRTEAGAHFASSCSAVFYIKNYSIMWKLVRIMRSSHTGYGS